MTDIDNLLLIDNGAATIKCGLATDESPLIIPNCKMKVKAEKQRQYIGDQIDNCNDCSGLYYILPHQKGYINNWDIQREIWDYVIKSKFKSINPCETNLVMTEPYFNFIPLQNNTDEVLFEEFGFQSVLRTHTGYLSSINHKYTACGESAPLACLIVDSGFSFTHIAPYAHNKEKEYIELKQGIRRIDVGGKLLTNHLKDLISYRQMNVMDETFVINQCKEDICYVALNFNDQLKRCEKNVRNKITKDYILPDFTNVKRGLVKDPDWRANRLNPNPNDPQFVRLGNERFQVPELLFHPSDIGLCQVGLVEAIVDSITSLPEKLQPLLFSNIVLTGGSVLIPGLRERLEKDIRSYCPTHYDVNVHLPDNPITHAWFGGKLLGTKSYETFKQLAVTKKKYEEFGPHKIR